ncbi:LamG-like jellyroll fold domain-containing protein [Paenibacillus montanisoli]|uniref:Glycosyltransferase subfamily 4-like N-terminal domain-containing protein n=1 Tax=Paenibacillus montanisoli TaxID=2081970 RepID=A0A328TXX3_9BACL|nr:LamG-like jellyroll fold domain-containing protein [Paenibacillus montanisoli]RAP74562.1 hypothetical protein DL346_21095 [Paenibacillus montanisoli]
MKPKDVYLQFFGGNGEIVAQSLFDSIRDSFTYEFWVKPEAEHEIDLESADGVAGVSGQRYVIAAQHGQQPNKAGAGVSIGINGISVYEHTTDYMPAVLVYQGSITDWTHIAVVYNNKTPSLYMNGKFIKTGVTSRKTFVHPSSIFASLQGYGSFIGQLKDIRIWNYARSQKQIMNDMYKKLAGNEPGLWGYWRVDEGLGSILYDSSPHMNHARINGTCNWGIAKKKHIREVVLFSHTNYLISIGGTEKCIHEQVQYFHKEGISVIQIFPGAYYPFLEQGESIYGVNIDFSFLGYFRIDELSDMLRKRNLERAFIHHLLHWRYFDFDRLATVLSKNKVKTTFCMHDLYPIMKNWREKYGHILSRVDHIIVPSEFIASKLTGVYSHLGNKISIQPYVNLTNKLEKTHDPSVSARKIRLAFLGYKAETKGWSTWEKIYRSPVLNDAYDLYHIGSFEQHAPNVKTYGYSFIRDGVMKATELLTENGIDLVLLWSLVPESFSYTLYESIAAGVPVLTYANSGNIAETVRNHKRQPIGRVFDGEHDLFQFLLDINAVREFIKLPRSRYTLEVNPYQK